MQLMHKTAILTPPNWHKSIIQISSNEINWYEYLKYSVTDTHRTFPR